MIKKILLFSFLPFYCFANLQNDFERAFTLNKQGDIVAASTLYRTITSQYPLCTQAIYNFAHTLKDLGDMQEAISAYKKVIEQEPSHAFAHVGMAQCYLSLGDYKNGFDLFEWRSSAIKDFKHDIEKLKKLVSSNADLTGLKILLRGEWGLGDNIQFIRFALPLKKRGAKILIQSYPALKQLFSLCPFLDHVFSVGDEFPSHDIQIPLLSLAYVCDATTDNLVTTLPYLVADQDLVKKWQRELIKDANFTVGICWSGNGDKDAPPLLNKNIPVDQFAPLMQLPNVSVYCLQQPSENHQTLVGLHAFDENFDKTRGQFMDTAAVMKNLDLVITIDTSIAHLAGALNVPVWALLPHRTDWRWMIDGTTSPWYPSMKLFRQPTPGAWNAVIEEVIKEIKGLTLQVHSPNKNGLIPLRANGEK